MYRILLHKINFLKKRNQSTATNQIRGDYFGTRLYSGLKYKGQLMGTARMKQEEEANKNNSQIVVRNMEKRNVGRKGKSSKQGLTKAKDLHMKLRGTRVPLP